MCCSGLRHNTTGYPSVTIHWVTEQQPRLHNHLQYAIDLWTSYRLHLAVALCNRVNSLGLIIYVHFATCMSWRFTYWKWHAMRSVSLGTLLLVLYNIRVWEGHRVEHVQYTTQPNQEEWQYSICLVDIRGAENTELNWRTVMDMQIVNVFSVEWRRV